MDFSWITLSVVSIEFICFGAGLWALKRWADRRYNALSAENATLREEVNRLTEEVNGLTEENTGIREENIGLRKEIDRHIETFKTFQSQADRRYTALDKENAALQKTVDNYITENAAAQKAIQKHTTQIERLQQQNQELQTGFDIMSGRYAELKEQLFPMLDQILERLSER